MTDMERLKQIYDIVVASWKMYKRHTSEPCTDEKYETIMREGEEIWKAHEGSGIGEAPKQIIFGFIEALEQEDKERLRQ
jgi:hypothetical protein